MALYAVYLFLAGWAYLRYYFRVFGIDTGWLGVGFNDTVADGFSVLFGPGVYLSLIYLVVFLATVVVDLWTKLKRSAQTIVAILLVMLFPMTFYAARRAGIEQANIDRGDRTSLPTIAFTAGGCDYRGKLVYIQSESLYLYNLTYSVNPPKNASCPFDLAGTTPAVPMLWIVRLSDLKDVTVLHYQKEAKP
jgi:hypothetical protein